MTREIEHAIFRIVIQNHPQVLRICKRFHCDNALDVKEAFRALRYKISFSNNTINITDIVHQFKWHGDEEKLWNLLAPYVNDGYIVWFGESGDTWRYIFEDGMMTVVSQDSYVALRTYEILPTLKNMENIPENIQKFIDDINID